MRKNTLISTFSAPLQTLLSLGASYSASLDRLQCFPLQNYLRAPTFDTISERFRGIIKRYINYFFTL